MLTKILKQKEIEIKNMPAFTQEQLNQNATRPFIQALRDSKQKPALIAEVKKASPSKGIICDSFDPVKTAIAYEKAGAACLSVLTDEMFFQGKLSYLKEIKAAVNLPLLRKDFIIDERQIEESYYYGADAILLIAAALSPEKLVQLYQKAKHFGLDCLVEIHSQNEYEELIHIFTPELIGINNRDLKTFTTSIQTTIDLKPVIGQKTMVVSESGIESSDDVKMLSDAGIDAMLIGESLMKAFSVDGKIRELYRNV